MKCAKRHAGYLARGRHAPATPRSRRPPRATRSVDEDIPTYIARLVKDMPSPDRCCSPSWPEKRANKADVEKAVNEFSLQKGPAEVPAFYDFNALQIAFDHVWKQLFDEAIPDLAYTANTLGKARFGVDSVVTTPSRTGSLIADTFFAISPVEVPPRRRQASSTSPRRSTTRCRSPSARSWSASRTRSTSANAQARSQRLRASGLRQRALDASAPDLRIIQSLTEQGERLIDSVRHDDYYTLHKTLRDLHDRLNGKYEFTVFAADKDYHSVNFGLLNTYRQKWTPLDYQAGKLVKTIPLSPKEERKYSVKITPQREALAARRRKKNNSSLTNEQHSTSRVEADIMAKAQNKTNFGLSAEGDYDIGISEGKSTTTFGVEALRTNPRRTGRTSASRSSRRCRTTRTSAAPRSTPRQTSPASRPSRARSSTRTTSWR